MTRRSGLLAVVTVAGIVALGWWASSIDRPDTPPSPLFEDVKQLTPTELPDGWVRCGGGPSNRADAKEGWWDQTFGPVVDGECDPLVTVTQIPPGDSYDRPEGTTNGGVGEEPNRTGAQHWSDEGEGSRGLYTTGSGGLQRLIVEGCCGPEATGEDFLLVAVAARDATREVERHGCTAPYSDLSQESFLDNFFARHQRARDDDGCPVRGDIVSWRTEPPNAHCWPNVVFLVVGDPVGTTFTNDDPTARLYVRDADQQLGDGFLPGPPVDVPPPDLDAELPPSARDTGFRLGDGALFIDEAQDEWVYVVEDDAVEAWPRDPRGHGCA